MFSIKEIIILIMTVLALIVYGLYAKMTIECIIIFIVIALAAEAVANIFIKALKKQYKGTKKNEDNIL